MGRGCKRVVGKVIDNEKGAVVKMNNKGHRQIIKSLVDYCNGVDDNDWLILSTAKDDNNSEEITKDKRM